MFYSSYYLLPSHQIEALVYKSFYGMDKNRKLINGAFSLKANGKPGCPIFNNQSSTDCSLFPCNPKSQTNYECDARMSVYFNIYRYRINISVNAYLNN